MNNKYVADGGVNNAYFSRVGMIANAKNTVIPGLEAQLQNQENANNTLQGYITQYDNAKADIETAQEEIDNARNAKIKRQEDWNKWDENNRNMYNELMAYWDFLQTGKTKNLFRLSTKSLQDKMDKGKMQQMLAKYTKEYAA